MNLNKKNWQSVKIGDISDVQYGSSYKSTDSVDGYKTFRMNEIVDGVAVDNDNMKTTPLDEKEFRKYKLNCGDILFNRTNSFEHVGRTGIFCLNGNYMFASYLLRLNVDKSLVNPNYLNTIMNSSWFQSSIKKYATKAIGQANINATSLSNFQIPLPPIDEQAKIAAVFQSLRQSLICIDAQLKNLKNLRQTLINNLKREKPTFGNIIDPTANATVCIGDIAIEIPDRTDNPSQCGFEKFVGLEDFETGELRINKWSSTEKLVSAMKLFKSGDILFARRNAYLKRASQVNFDGVCSGDAIVMRAQEEKILPQFLAMIMNTREFWDYAISNAAGTMSKRVKWRDLAAYSFQLPDLDTQRNIWNSINELEMNIEQLASQKSNIELLKSNLLNKILD